MKEKLIDQLKAAFAYEEWSLIKFQHECYGKLPGSLSKKELEKTRAILDTILVQSLEHANTLADLIKL